MDTRRTQALRGLEAYANGPLVPRSRTPEPDLVAAAKRYTATDDRRGFNARRRNWVLVAMCGLVFGVGVPAIAIAIDAGRVPPTTTTTQH